MKVFTNKKKMRGYREFLYILPFIILVAIFAYYPLYGWAYAFFDYKPPLMVLRNTFAMSGLTILFSWLPMIFAVFLNEIKCMPFRKFVQTVTTLPNFISWVLVFSICYCMFNSTGMANSLLIQMGVLEKPIAFLQSSNHIWLKMWLWSTWKSLGWSAIMYIAAISGIDAELYEAAKVDGATRMQLIWNITIPSLLPTYFVLLMLNIANFLSNGMEQYYVFQNAFNMDTIQVLDLYVYNLAMGSGSYSVSTALSMLKSLISVILLCGANTLSKVLRGDGFI